MNSLEIFVKLSASFSAALVKLSSSFPEAHFKLTSSSLQALLKYETLMKLSWSSLKTLFEGIFNLIEVFLKLYLSSLEISWNSLETHLKFFEGIFKVHWSILKALLKLSWNSHETLLKLLETLLNVESWTFMNTLHRQNDRPQLHFLGYFWSQKCVPFGKTLFLFG